jgi:hypothetical protein
VNIFWSLIRTNLISGIKLICPAIYKPMSVLCCENCYNNGTLILRGNAFTKHNTSYHQGASRIKNIKIYFIHLNPDSKIRIHGEVMKRNEFFSPDTLPEGETSDDFQESLYEDIPSMQKLHEIYL